MTTRECMYDCTYPAAPGKRKCVWHGLLAKPIEVQIEAAEQRREHAHNVFQAGQEIFVGALWPAKTIPKAKWPDGERFCSGCQGFVPLFYCTGSRCKAHSALSAHSGRLESIYGITRKYFEDLMVLQGGVCAVCGQEPKTKRLAVDHDHVTGEVRGLLCADLERGCNKAVLGSLEARAVDSALEAVRRLEAYLMKTPYQRLKEERDAGLASGEVEESAAAGGGQGSTTSDSGAGIDSSEDRSAQGATLPGSTPDPLRAPAPDWG